MTYQTPVAKTTADGEWTATTTHSIDTVKLTVKGTLQEPTPGYKLALTRIDAPDSDPATLALALSVTAPTGIEPDVVTATTVEYEQTFVIPRNHVPTRVTIYEAATSVDVKPAA